MVVHKNEFIGSFAYNVFTFSGNATYSTRLNALRSFKEIVDEYFESSDVTNTNEDSITLFCSEKNLISVPNIAKLNEGVNFICLGAFSRELIKMILQNIKNNTDANL